MSHGTLTAMFHRMAIGACAVFILLFGGSALGAKATESSQFIWLSDIHFNPFADRTLVDRLAAAPVAQWPAVLDSAANHSFSSFGQDTNWPLFSSALAAIKQTIPRPAFTIVTGDLLAHHLREQFDATATQHDDTSYLEFVSKAVEFVVMELGHLSPTTRGMVALGNNDADCGDYLMQSDGPFLRNTNPVIAAFAGLQPDAKFTRSWNAFGSYSVPHPTIQGRRILVLDTTFLSYRHRAACGGVSADAGGEMLTWLNQELSDAKRRHEKVWLMYHIPPGIDGFATLRAQASSKSSDVISFWRETYETRFEELMRRYGPIVEASLAGHTHLDDFRLIDNGLRSHAVIQMAPALSPNIRQNPSFRIVTISRRGSLQDQATYYLTNLETAASPGAAVWKQEYSFDRAWNLHDLSVRSYERLWRRVSQPGAERDQWIRFYSVSKPGPFITPETFQTAYCASGYPDAAQFQSCISERKSENRSHSQ